MKEWITDFMSGFGIVLVPFLCIINLSAEEPFFFEYESGPIGFYTFDQHEMLGKVESRTEVEKVSLIRFTDSDLYFSESPAALKLPDGDRIFIDQITVKTEGFEGIVLTGKIAGNRGSVTLVIREEKVTGLLSVDNRIYSIEPLGNGLHALALIDHSKFPTECKPVISEQGPENEQRYEDETYSGDEPVVVDILVVYTNDASDAVGDIRGLIDLSIFLTNESFENSDIPIELRLTVAAGVSYQETGGDLTDELYWMMGSAYLRDLTERNGADLTVMLVATGSYCGRAFMNSGPGSALSVVRASCSASNYIFAHEIGHNFGADHDIETDVNGYYEYGHGYRYFPGEWRTIMAYSPPINVVNYWSNPDIYFEGTPMGTARWENNARVLRERADRVANFRTLPPLTIDITGTDTLRFGEEGRWSINARGGYPPYTYSWLKLYHNDDSKESGIGQFVTEVGQRSFTLESEITDRFGYTATASLSVVVPETPDRFIVHQNFPNPFNSGTTISYEIPVSSDVRISVYDFMGRKLIDLIDGVHEPGYHSTVWNGTNGRGNTVASGVYIYRVAAAAIEETGGGDSHFSAHTMLFLK